VELPPTNFKTIWKSQKMQLIDLHFKKTTLKKNLDTLKEMENDPENDIVEVMAIQKVIGKWERKLNELEKEIEKLEAQKC